MILRRRGREPSAAATLAVVAEDLDAFSGLRAGLEAELPGGGFSTVAPADLPRALRPGRGAEPPGGVLIGVGAGDAEALESTAELVGAARAAGVPVILLAQDLPPSALHRLMRAGADDFLPVPVPQGALAEALDRLRARSDGDEGRRRNRDGAVVAVYGVAGGVGATTFAVNVAWEMAEAGRKEGLKVCVLDLDFQYGSVATYLDLPRREAVYELISDMENADASGFEQALAAYQGRLPVLTAPLDALPLDIVGPASVEKLLRLARDTHDVVVVDLPQALTLWTETVLNAAERFYAMMEIDMRSAQNMLRLLRTLRAEDLPFDRIEYVMNRAPGFSGRARIKKMAESLGIEYAFLLPDGGKAVPQACDQGEPLARFAGGNALRKEIRKSADTIAKALRSAKAGA